MSWVVLQCAVVAFSNHVHLHFRYGGMSEAPLRFKVLLIFLATLCLITVAMR